MRCNSPMSRSASIDDLPSNASRIRSQNSSTLWLSKVSGRFQARASFCASTGSRTGSGVDIGAELLDVPAPSAAAGAAIAAARTRLGLPYVWGATGPDSFDCSGLTGWAYHQAGISLPRTASQQYIALPHVPLDRLAPGDLVFYATDVNNPATIHHVGMYVGAGLSLYAPQTGSFVKIGPVDYGRIIGAVRPAALR